jgi:hypothetical protein
MPTWLIRFDRDGTCLSPLTRARLLDTVRNERPEQLILFSHGWNNDFNFAGRLYGGFLKHLEPILPAAAKPVFVGIIWPSTLMPGDSGPNIAGSGPVPAAADEAALEEIAASLEADEAARLRALAARATVSADEAAALAEGAAGALGASSAEAGEDPAPPDSAELLAAARRLQAEGDGADRFSDDFGLRGSGGSAGANAAGLADFLDPRNVLRVFTVYQMKDRAGRVGAGGVHQLLSDLLAEDGIRIHAVGHSYGAKVMLSALCAGPLPRPLDSLLLLQPAVSHLCFAEHVPGRGGAGGYRSALDPERVVQPILTTYSRHDQPLHNVFHLAVRRGADLGELHVAAGTRAGEPPSVFAALGGYGPRGAGETLIDPVPEPEEALTPPPAARLVGLDGTFERRISGHGDVTTPLTAALLARQMGA